MIIMNSIDTMALMNCINRPFWQSSQFKKFPFGYLPKAGFQAGLRCCIYLVTRSVIKKFPLNWLNKELMTVDNVVFFPPDSFLVIVQFASSKNFLPRLIFSKWCFIVFYIVCMHLSLFICDYVREIWTGNIIYETNKVPFFSDQSSSHTNCFLLSLI